MILLDSMILDSVYTLILGEQKVVDPQIYWL